MDSYCPVTNGCVYRNYSATLNQVNIVNNNNKFYIVQVIQESPTRYHVFTRYGRVGDKGVTGLKSFSNVTTAIQAFCTCYKSKTGNIWGDNGPVLPFVKKSNKYTLLQMDTVIEKVTEPSKDEISTLDLDSRISKIMRMIGNNQMFQQTMMNLDIDTQRLPLGKISKKQIHEANEILSKISSNLSQMTAKESELYSSEFWTLIPYSCGRNRPPIINNVEQIRTCSTLLETIENIEIAGCILRNNSTEYDIYRSLGLTLIPVENDSNDMKLLKTYVDKTHAQTHKYRLELVSALKIEDSSSSSSTKFDIENHRLLFHGSRMANFMGIMKEGLRLPQVYQIANGSTLGAGIYFADSVTKSFNYTFSTETADTGFIVVCEVALGSSQYVTKCTPEPLPDTFESRIAHGRSHPDLKEFEMYNGNVIVPCGRLIDNPDGLDSTFLYNEYVIYDKSQYKFKYLLELKKV